MSDSLFLLKCLKTVLQIENLSCKTTKLFLLFLDSHLPYLAKKKKKVEKWNHLLEAFCEMFEAIFQKLDSLG